MKLTRRELVEHLRNIICAAGSYQLLPFSLQAETPSAETPPDDEHFFIFVELKGGVHHLISTDHPDPDKLNAIDKDGSNGIVMRFSPKDKKGFYTDTELTSNFKKLMLDNSGNSDRPSQNPAFLPNGRFVALPYQQNPADGFLVGSTHQGQYQYRLGIAGLPLANYTNDISVLRGVYMLGDFHTPAGQEVFSGSNRRSGIHVAGVLAKLLEERHGKKPLDNLVFEGAYYSVGDGRSSKLEIKLSFSLLGTLAKHYRDAATSGGSPSTTISQALQENLPFSDTQDTTMEKYIKAMEEMGEMTKRLQSLGAKDKDISLELGMQLKTCLELFSNNISRVVTICVGSRNSINNVDQFGLFDSHSGLYHTIKTQEASGSSQHHLSLTSTMQDLANFIETLKTTDYKEGKKWSDVVTLVVSSEFSRPSNFSGNEDDSESRSFGNGHYNFNNNYILFGKNIKNGVWLGESDPITRFPYVVDFNKLNRGMNSNEVFTNTVTKNQSGQMKMMGDFEGTDTLNPNMNQPLGGMQVPQRKDNPEQRAFMAKDVVKTIMAAAGVSKEDFHQLYYTDPFYEDAKLIKQLLR